MVVLGEIVLFYSFSFLCFKAHGGIMSQWEGLNETPQTVKPFTKIFNLQNVFHMAESCSLQPTQSI